MAGNQVAGVAPVDVCLAQVADSVQDGIVVGNAACAHHSHPTTNVVGGRDGDDPLVEWAVGLDGADGDGAEVAHHDGHDMEVAGSEDILLRTPSEDDRVACYRLQNGGSPVGPLDPFDGPERHAHNAVDHAQAGGAVVVGGRVARGVGKVEGDVEVCEVPCGVPRACACGLEKSVAVNAACPVARHFVCVGLVEM